MKNNNRIVLMTLAFGFFQNSPAVAYELSTHARVTYKTYEASALVQDQNLIKDLGIDTYVLSSPDNVFGQNYFDISGSSANVRSRNSFEQVIMDDSNNPNPIVPRNIKEKSLPGWLMRGAIREDDYATAFGIWRAPNPQPDQDKPQAFWRVLNHFFDPYYNRPLTLSPAALQLFSLASGESDTFRAAPNWALGKNDAFAASPVPDSGTRNHYTVLDAREAMYRALTGQDKNGNPVAATEADRKKYWITTFRSLGDVVHLLQGMVQPQHMRNDSHCGDYLTACKRKGILS